MPDLSHDDLMTILRSSLKSQHAQPISHKMMWLSEEILGERYQLEIKYTDDNGEENSQRYFLKDLNNNLRIAREISHFLQTFEKEQFFYEQILPDFIQKGLDVRFAPQSYFSKPHFVVLEDLTLRGFRSPHEIFLNVAQCEKALETLAKFHTSSVIYEFLNNDRPGALYAKNPQMYEDKVLSQEKNVTTKWLTVSVDALFTLIGQLPLADEEMTDFATELRKLLDNAKNHTANNDSDLLTTILHGGLWSNNFLFRYDKDELKECILVDYQLLKFGPPAVDAIQLILSNTRKTFRMQHTVPLLNHYYKHFAGNLENWNINPEQFMTSAEFLYQYERAGPLMKLQCICDRCVTFMPDQYLAESLQSDENLYENLYTNRDTLIVDCFNNDEFFKELILEDMLELRDMLLVGAADK